MKISCEVIQDLLPLYVDQICSEHSKCLVEEHLRECEKCRNVIADTHSVPNMIIQPEEQKKDKIVTIGLKKVRRRWVLSLIAVLMIIPLYFLFVMGYNQISGNGISFTNIDDVVRAKGFVEALESGDCENVANYLDFSGSYSEIQGLINSTVENFSPRLIEVTIDNEVWIAEESFAERYLNDTNDFMQTWSYLVNNGIHGVLIPEATWYDIITTDPDAYQKNADGTETIYDHPYIKLETVWGAFMVDVHSLEDLTADEISRYVYFGQILLLPLNVYSDLMSEIDGLALQSYNEIQSRYGKFSGMSENEYAEIRRQEYCTSLAGLFQSGYSIVNKGYHSVYSIDNRVVVTYTLYVQCPNEDDIIYLDISSTNGKITEISTHYANQADWIDIFVDSVFVS